MTFKKRYMTEANGINSIADLKSLADYHSDTKDLFNKSAPFMKTEERQSVADTQYDLGQSIDQKWSDRFNQPAPTPEMDNDLTSGMPDINSVTGPVSGLSDMFG